MENQTEAQAEQVQNEQTEAQADQPQHSAMTSFDITEIQKALTEALDAASVLDGDLAVRAFQTARQLRVRLDGIKSGKITQAVEYNPNGEKIVLGSANLTDGLCLSYMFGGKQTVSIPSLAELKDRLTELKENLASAILDERYSEVVSLTASVQSAQKDLDNSKYASRMALIALLESALKEQRELLAGLQQLDNPKPANGTNNQPVESAKLQKNIDRLAVASESGDVYYLESTQIPYEGLSLVVDYNNHQYPVRLIHTHTDGWAWVSSGTGKIYNSLRKYAESGEIKNSRGNTPSLARWEPKVKLTDGTSFIKWVISKNS